jgi:hypothetical protein
VFAYPFVAINPLNAELNPICHLLALLGAHLILHISRIRVSVIENKNEQCTVWNRVVILIMTQKQEMNFMQFHRILL